YQFAGADRHAAGVAGGEHLSRPPGDPRVPLFPSAPPAARPAALRAAIEAMPRQLIGEVSRLGLGRPDTIPLWYGESDLPTPRFIRDAAHEAMCKGRTFYTHRRGLPELRMALAVYMTWLYGTEIDMERVTVTMSGMAAIMLAMQAILEAGD